MRITVLVDNTDGMTLRGEWGLSFYIEYGDKNVLLDTGLSPLFAANAEKLGADITKVDYAVLSHAHDDHANGMDAFFALNDHAKFYVAKSCAENCYERRERSVVYGGIPKGIMKRHADRIVKAEPDMYIDDGIRLLGHTTPGLEEIGAAEEMYQRQGFRRLIPDDFSHEQSLVFELPEGIVIFNSCSHAGADNIINEVRAVYPGKRILAMIGGFHLFNKSEEYVEAFSRRIEETGVEQIWTGHCTGTRSLGILRRELGNKVHAFYTGAVFRI